MLMPKRTKYRRPHRLATKVSQKLVLRLLMVSMD